MTRDILWSHASVCLSVSVAACLHYCTDPDVTWRSGRGCPLVVHCWTDLQLGHGLRCYGNIMRTRNVSEYMVVLALCLVVNKQHISDVAATWYTVTVDFHHHPLVVLRCLETNTSSDFYPPILHVGLINLEYTEQRISDITVRFIIDKMLTWTVMSAFFQVEPNNDVSSLRVPQAGSDSSPVSERPRSTVPVGLLCPGRRCWHSATAAFQ